MSKKSDNSNIEKEIQFLRHTINRHNRLYYVLADSEISDQEYDQLYKKLEALEQAHPELISPDSPTQRVGGEPLKEFESIKHTEPMLSLDNTYSLEELEAWDQRVGKALPGEKVEYSVELKIDGVAIALKYRNRNFVQAVTRGDGEMGDDVTTNIKTLKSLALELDVLAPAGDLEVRGEVFLPLKVLKNSMNKKKLTGKNICQSSECSCRLP